MSTYWCHKGNLTCSLLTTHRVFVTCADGADSNIFLESLGLPTSDIFHHFTPVSFSDTFSTPSPCTARNTRFVFSARNTESPPNKKPTIIWYALHFVAKRWRICLKSTTIYAYMLYSCCIYHTMRMLVYQTCLLKVQDSARGLSNARTVSETGTKAKIYWALNWYHLNWHTGHVTHIVVIQHSFTWKVRQKGTKAKISWCQWYYYIYKMW